MNNRAKREQQDADVLNRYNEASGWVSRLSIADQIRLADMRVRAAKRKARRARRPRPGPSAGIVTRMGQRRSDQR